MRFWLAFPKLYWQSGQEDKKMTQHLMAEDMQEDIRTLKHLGIFVAMFAGFSLCLAISVALFAP
jgi:hypothetical protein